MDVSRDEISYFYIYICLQHFCTCCQLVRGGGKVICAG